MSPYDGDFVVLVYIALQAKEYYLQKGLRLQNFWKYSQFQNFIIYATFGNAKFSEHRSSY